MGTIWAYYLYVYMRLNYSPAAVWTIALIISIVCLEKGDSGGIARATHRRSSVEDIYLE